MTESDGLASGVGQIGNGILPIELGPGTGIRLLVDGTVYETRTIYPLERGQHADPEEATSIGLEPYPSGGIVGRDDPEVEVQFVSSGHKDAVAAVSPDSGLDHGSVQRELLKAAAVLADEGRNEAADEAAATALGYWSEVRNGE